MKKSLVVPFFYLIVSADLLMFNRSSSSLESSSAWAYPGCELLLSVLTSVLLYLLVRRHEVMANQIQERALRFRRFINALPDYVLVKDRSGRVIEMNEKARMLLQSYGQEDLPENTKPCRPSFCLFRGGSAGLADRAALPF
jgi:PAS domain-containing protein